MMHQPAPMETRNALIAGLVCYVLWGVFPLLFMAMARAGFSAPEILAQRGLWAVAFAAVLVLVTGRLEQVRRVLTTPATLGWLALSTVMILINWGAYVWATTNHHTLEASLGYYINPLLNMVAGLVVFRERIDRWGWIAIGAAAVGVVLQAFALGRAPWLSLVIAFSFASYGIIRKRVDADAQTGLFVECLLMIPVGIGLLLWLNQTAGVVGFSSPAHWGWAISSGLATVLPLVLFAWSARRLPLSTIGFLQFLAPTLQFCIGVASGEPLTLLRILSFGFIWTGAAVFAGAALWRKRAERQAIRLQIPE